MEKYDQKDFDNNPIFSKVDFDDIPNSQTIYHEKKTDSPDGF